MLDKGVPFIKSTWPFISPSGAPVMGLTRAVLNCGGVVAWRAGFSILTCEGDSGSGPVLPTGEAASIDAASCLSFVGQCRSDLGGIAPALMNQHLRPSMSRQDHQPVLGGPGVL